MSNLLLIKKKDVENFIQEGEMTIPIIKKSQNVQQTFYLTKRAEPKILFIQPYLNELLQGKEANDSLFTTKKGEPVDKTTFGIELNKWMRAFSQIYGKNLQTHSFRVNMASQIRTEHGLIAAKNLLNHSNLQTTELYVRNKMGKEDIEKMLDSVYYQISSF